MEKYGQLILYKDKNGKKDIEVKLYEETVWLNQNQIVDLIGNDKKVNYKEFLLVRNGENNYDKKYNI